LLCLVLASLASIAAAQQGPVYPEPAPGPTAIEPAGPLAAPTLEPLEPVSPAPASDSGSLRQAGRVSAPGATVSEGVGPEPLPGQAPLPTEPQAGPNTTPGDLTVDELLGLAMAHNPTLSQAAQQVAALRGKWLQAGLYPNPAVGYLGDELGAEGTAGKQGATFAQQIVTAGKLRLDRAVVSHEIEQARLAWELQLRRVQNDVRATAYRVMASQRHIRFHERMVGISKEAMETTQQLFQAKEASHVDVLKAQVEFHTAELLLESVQQDYQRLWRQLAVLVGVPDMGPTALRDELDTQPPDWTWDQVWQRLRAQSPELAGALAAVERAECELARQCAGRVPDVEVEAEVLYDETLSQTVAAAGVSMPLPVFDRNQGNIRQAQAQLAAARREVDRVELAIRHRLADVWRQYADARVRTARYSDQILPTAKKSLKLTQIGYRQGELGYLELLTAQHMYFTTAEEHARALEELWVGAVQI